ncbi:hypothetical protein H0H93_000868, partial [Arthromyces matolae]
EAVTPKRIIAKEAVYTATARIENADNEIDDALVPAVKSYAIYPAKSSAHVMTSRSVYLDDYFDLPDLVYPPVDIDSSSGSSSSGSSSKSSLAEEPPDNPTAEKAVQTIEDPVMFPDPYDVYLRSLPIGYTPENLIVAKDSEPLRAIMMVVDGKISVESIVDSGSQIVAMSEEVCNDLHIKFDPTVRLNMQSANGTVDSSLGLARNVPCSIGDITLYLQIHVLRNPSYDILLGKPFD